MPPVALEFMDKVAKASSEKEPVNLDNNATPGKKLAEAETISKVVTDAKSLTQVSITQNLDV